MIKKIRKTKARTSPAVATFSADSFVKYVDTGKTNNRKPVTTTKPTNGKKPMMVGEDRFRLREIEIMLNNCLNLAQRIESKRVEKVVQSLRDAQSMIQRLRA